MMAVTSDELLAFVTKAAETTVNLDANGEVAFTIPSVLGHDALASALRCVADLAAHESSIAFAQQQYEDQRPTHVVPPFTGPRPVN